MTNREIATILFNMSLDMDYADCLEGNGKEEISILESEIASLQTRDSALFHVLESIAMENEDITTRIS